MYRKRFQEKFEENNKKNRKMKFCDQVKKWEDFEKNQSRKC